MPGGKLWRIKEYDQFKDSSVDLKTVKTERGTTITILTSFYNLLQFTTWTKYASSLKIFKTFFSRHALYIIDCVSLVVHLCRMMDQLIQILSNIKIYIIRSTFLCQFFQSIRSINQYTGWRSVITTSVNAC